jgi:hypothetical protein
MRILRTLLAAFWLLAAPLAARAEDLGSAERHLLYVAVPGIRADVQRGGMGVLVYDVDQGYRFVRRIPVPALGDEKHALPVKGICACATTGKLYVATTKTLSCLDLATDAVLWDKAYDSGCDRMAIAPDGKWIYEPTFEGKYWHVIDAANGDEVAKIEPNSGAHNTVYALDGKHVYLAGLKSPLLTVADPATHSASGTVGPFAAPIRPFTVNGKSTLVYVCVNELLGFEIGDLTTGKKICRVEVQGEEHGPTLRHGCPSHGVGLTPDERELWLCDGHNSELHVFDNTVMPPKQVASIALRDQPGWVTFSLDGRWAWPSTGEMIDVKTRKIVTALKDEAGRDVHSEKVVEIDFVGQKPVRNGDQFGVGRVR